MENHRAVVKILINLWGGTLLVIPFFAFAYDDKTTHPALTQEIVKLFNAEFRDVKISDEDAEHIIQGSIDEDEDTRWLQHFYDPVQNRGLVLFGNELNEYKGLAAIIAGAKSEFQSSKAWAQDSVAQGELNRFTAGVFSSYFTGEKDYSWERAIFEYAWEDKKRGLNALGHVLHLLEDASVPDHTRNDPHPPILDLGSPYEHWTKKFDRGSTNIATKSKPILLNDLGEYFDQLATYSNKNFFSKDTVSSLEYPSPKITKIKPGFLYGTDPQGNTFKLVKIIKGFGDNEVQYSIEDDDQEILSDYWSLLSEQAVLHGAGVIKLFFDEVEKEKQTKILYEKNRSWVEKQWDSLRSGVAGIVGALFGNNNPPQPSPAPQNPPPKETPNIIPLPSPNQEPPPPPVNEPTPQEPKPPAVEPPTGITSPLPAATTPPQPLPQSPPPSSNTSSAVPIAGVAGAPPPPAQNQNPGPTEEPPPPSPPEEPPPPSPPPDTTPPNISLTVSECNQSLSSEGCLLATTTVTLEWSSDAPDLDHYAVMCEANGSPCQNFNSATTTATTTAYAIPTDTTIYTFTAKAVDINGNESSPAAHTVEIASRPVVINEIAWAGTSATRSQDEWLELYNPTAKPIDLSKMQLRSLTDAKPNIPLSGTIPAKGYYLIERSDDQTISDIPADLAASFGSGSGAGLSNSGEALAIEYKGIILDQTPEVATCSTWCGGAAGGQYITMERYDPLASGKDATNWGSSQGFLAYGKNADGARINGTPQQRNTINYLIDTSGTLTRHKTITKIKNPYIIPSRPFTIQEHVTLTVEPGVIIKFLDNAALAVNGIIKAEGTNEAPIVFTSFHDDDCGIAGGCGDTNATTTPPNPGDWGSIKILADGSTLDHVTVRYGGQEDILRMEHYANIRVDNASFTLTHSTIERSRLYGAWFRNASGVIESNVFRENTHNALGQGPGIGLVVSSGSPSITKNSFVKNTKGLLVESKGASPKVEENTFTEHTREAITNLGAYPAFSGNTATANGVNGIMLQGTVSQDYELSANLPYVVNGMTYTVAKENTLTIPAGTVVKLSGAGSISVSGKLNAEGTQDAKIIFTSLHDDDCGIAGGCGDTDATSTAPAPGDWHSLIFNDGSASSTLRHTLIRFGGAKSPFDPIQGALHVKNSSIEITDSLVEQSYRIGVFLKNSTSTVIQNSTIQYHTEPSAPPGEPSYGLLLEHSSPVIQQTVFKNNKTGIRADGTSLVQNGGGITFEQNTINTVPAGLIP